MIRQYRGLKIPDGLNKDSAREMDLTESCAALFYDHGSRPFCPGGQCRDCICDSEHRKALKELLKMWEKEEEDNPIKPGMVVQTENNDYCLVERVSDEGIYGWSVWHNVTAQNRPLCELRGYRYFIRESVRAVYKLKSGGNTDEAWMPSGDSIRRLTSRSDYWERLWEEVDPPVLELTVSDIEKKYGRKVKIVGEQNA